MDRNERIAAAFDRLFRTYRQSDQGDPETVLRERVERAKVYFEAVSPYELHDIEAAVENFVTGMAPGVNPAFAPPAPQVAAEVRRVMNLRLESERRTRMHRPALPPPDIERSPEARQRAKELAAEAIRKMAGPDGAAADAERDKRSKERGERELRWLRDRGDLVEVPGLSVPVSSTLLRQFSVGDPDGDRDVA